jgi:cysteine synthase A
MGAYRDVIAMIGNTPLVRINRLVPDGAAEVWAKLEGVNPGGSVKDRISLSMIEQAERDGLLKPGGTIVEPTSGNTGIGLAMVAAIKGYKMILTMPETMSIERRQLLEALGAELMLTPGDKGMKGAVNWAGELVNDNPGYYMPQQFNNPTNPAVHRQTTAIEILNAFDTPPDGFVAGVGTGGTITGVGEVLKNENPEVYVAAVEPKDSPVLSGGQPGPHKIAGIGAGFVPQVLNTQVYDEVVQVTNDESAHMARELSLKEGVMVGISSGAAMHAALKVAERLGAGKKVVVIFPDRAEKYLSTGMFAKSE